jgi:hypothetical protein
MSDHPEVQQMAGRCRMSRFGLLALTCLTSALCAAAEQSVGASQNDTGARWFDDTLPFYTQKLDLVMASEATAAKAKLAMLPLYQGKKWGVTCRWDDNSSGANAKLSALMKAHGIRGTFYLNGSGIFSGRSCTLKDDSAKGQAELKNLIADVLVDGHSLGSHGWTHALPGLLCKNRMFEEFMRNRIQLEAISDSPVMSHALAFNAYGNLFEPSLSGKAMAASLFRSGIYALALWEDTHQWPYPVPSPYTISTDGDKPETVRAKLAKVLANDSARETDPCLQFSIHPGGHQDAENEGRIFDLVANKPEYWYCTQNEYAAYRTQLRLTRLTTSVAGRTIKVVLSRPAVDGLNDPIPITFALREVEPSDLREMKVEGATIERQDGEGEIRFSLSHDRDQRLPTKIDWIANEENAATLDDAKHCARDFPGVSGLLWKDGETLKWRMKNTTGVALSNIQAIYRLPIAYQNGSKRVYFDTLAPETELTQSEPLALASEEPKDRWGLGFFAVEISFTQGQQRGRLYLTTSAKDLVRLDDSYPNNHFVRLGPIPKEEYVPQMAEDIASRKAKQIVLKNGKVLTFAKIELTPERSDLLLDLDPETVYATGGAYMSRWKGDVNLSDGIWLYRSVIVSQNRETAIFWPTPNPYAVPGNAIFNHKTIFLNGQKLPPYDAPCTLNAGPNDLLIAYETAPLSIENIAFFCRFAAFTPGHKPPWTGLEPRLKSIRYAVPMKNDDPNQ